MSLSRYNQGNHLILSNIHVVVVSSNRYGDGPLAMNLSALSYAPFLFFFELFNQGVDTMNASFLDRVETKGEI